MIRWLIDAVSTRMDVPGKPRPQMTRDGRPYGATHWGLSKQQLQALREESWRAEEFDGGDNVRDFVRKYVVPQTAGTGMGYALMVNQACPKRVNLMVSHAWDENADRFFDDLIEEMYDGEAAFVCFLALYQGQGEEIAAQLGSDILRGPFTLVIRQVKSMCGRMLIVPNDELQTNGQGLYSRMWCDLEIYFALKTGCLIKFTRRTTREHLFGSGAFSSRNARCGNPALPMNSDEQNIRNVIETMPVYTIEQTQVSYIFQSVVIVLPLTLLMCDFVTSVLRCGCGMAEFFETWLLIVVPSALVSAWVPRSFGHNDPFSDLDEMISGAAEFNCQHPGKTLDPVAWRVTHAAERSQHRYLKCLKFLVPAFIYAYVFQVYWLSLFSYTTRAADPALCYRWFLANPCTSGPYLVLVVCLRDLFELVTQGSSRHRRWATMAARLVMPVAFLVSVCASCSTDPENAGMPVGLATAGGALSSIVVIVAGFPSAFTCTQRPGRMARAGDPDAGSLQLTSAVGV